MTHGWCVSVISKSNIAVIRGSTMLKDNKIEYLNMLYKVYNK